MTIDSMDALLEEQLRDLYDAEKQLVTALPKLSKAVSSEELRQAIDEHLEVTKGHVQRLEEVFSALELPAKGKQCAGMKGLIAEGEETANQHGEGDLVDAAIIGACQKVEHYEIAGYGTAAALAEMMGNEDVASLLQQTLDEEKEADETLTEISEALLTEVVAEANGDDEDEDEEDEEDELPVGSDTRKISGQLSENDTR